MLKKFVLFLFVFLILTFPALAQDEEIRQWAISAEASSEYGTTSWSASQAVGAPDSLICGDAGTAWASASASEVATLTVYFGVAVIPTEINIYQNYNPGAIVAVTLITVDGDEKVLDDEGDAPDECPGVHVVEVDDVEDAVIGVIIEVDQSEINNWSEIDAVELVGTPMEEGIISQWASEAEASSEFGSDSWSAAQATGAPDTSGCFDATTAWASATSTEEATLIVYFDVPVMPLELYIYQNYNPGAIVSVEMISLDGESFEFELSEDEAAVDCPGVVYIAFEESDILVNAVAIHLDQSITNNWSEIDAVQLIGTAEGASADLSESFELDGFSIDYPEDWATTVDEGDIPVLANSEDILDSRDELEDGDLIITVILPESLEDALDVDATDDIDELLQTVLDVGEIDGEVEDYDALDNPAVIAFVEDESTPGEDTLIMVEYDDGAIFYFVATGGDYEDVESLVIDIINSAEYEG